MIYLPFYSVNSLIQIWKIPEKKWTKIKSSVEQQKNLQRKINCASASNSVTLLYTCTVQRNARVDKQTSFNCKVESCILKSVTEYNDVYYLI